jgi:hypothetical protein
MHSVPPRRDLSLTRERLPARGQLRSADTHAVQGRSQPALAWFPSSACDQKYGQGCQAGVSTRGEPNGVTYPCRACWMRDNFRSWAKADFCESATRTGGESLIMISCLSRCCTSRARTARRIRACRACSCGEKRGGKRKRREGCVSTWNVVHDARGLGRWAQQNGIDYHKAE